MHIRYIQYILHIRYIIHIYYVCFLGASTGSPLYCFHNAIYVWLHVTDIYIYIYIYVYKYIYNTSSYTTIITHVICQIMYNTSSYTTIVTLNLYVNTSFLQMAAFRKL